MILSECSSHTNGGTTFRHTQAVQDLCGACGTFHFGTEFQIRPRKNESTAFFTLMLNSLLSISVDLEIKPCNPEGFFQHCRDTTTMLMVGDIEGAH
jgi:hypothetical protein